MNAVTTTSKMAPAPVTMGFGDLASFEFLQRTSKAFANSTMVPTAYQAMVTKGYGDRATVEPNPAALSNCMIALDMAQRMNANPLMIMQNLHIIEGRPSWSSQFIIAAINNCGKFSPLRFDLQWLDEIDAIYSTFEWEDRKKVEKKHKVRIKNARCVAWAVEKGTRIPDFGLDDLKDHGGVYGCCKAYGIPLLESAPVTMEMAVNEGWYGKNGSKWRSMPDLMLRYRSAAFFGRIYAPELLMGLPTAEELQDVFVQDGAGGVVNAGAQSVPKSTGTLDPTTGTVHEEPTNYPDEDFTKGLAGWAALVVAGKKSQDDLIATLESKAPLSDDQKAALSKAIKDASPQDVTPRETSADAPNVDPEQLAQRMRNAQDTDVLYEAANLIDAVPEQHRQYLNEVFNTRLGELEG